MTDIELRNENGKIVGYDENGNQVPVSFDSVSAGGLTSTASGGGTWKDMFWLLQQGYCVNSRGNVYSGSTAPQDAVDDIMNNAAKRGLVWLGRSRGNLNEDSYAHLRIESNSAVEMVIRGMGSSTRLDGGTTDHGLTLYDSSYSQSGCARLRIQDVCCETDSTSSYDGVHVEGVHEVWLTRVMSQTPGRYGFAHLDAARIWYTDCFTEGSDVGGLRIESLGNKNPMYSGWKGGTLHCGAGDLISIQDPAAPSNTIQNWSIRADNYSYSAGSYNLLSSNGGTLNFSMLTAGRGSGNTSTTADDDIAFYGPS